VIVYADWDTPLSTLTALRAFRRRVLASAARPSVSDARDLLVDFGEIEAALVDALSPEVDAPSTLIAGAGDVSLSLGDLFCRALGGTDAAAVVEVIDRLLRRLEDAPLPPVLRVHPAEGYAQYGVYPDLYVDAARRFAAANGGRSVFCIGIRGIGTSLSAAVAAALLKAGVATQRLTVRPRGHPFARSVRWSPAIVDSVRRLGGETVCAIVDEGPGLSGSSFASVAQALNDGGVPDERIVFFPSWNADGVGLVSDDARRRWPRHRRWVSDFDEAFVRSGRLAAAIGTDHLTDLSAGCWRRLFFDEADAPAAHPQHERRKYLFKDGKARRIARFAGLGRHGRERAERAATLAAHAWGLAPLALRDGFLVLPFVSGQPLRPHDDGENLATHIARYVAFVARTFPSETPTDVDRFLEMIHVNAGEAGIHISRAAEEALSAGAACVRDTAAAQIDARMLPHEWIAACGGVRKVDALDHHGGHFFPGPADCAWDVAATLAEFAWPPATCESFVAAYQRHSADATIARRLAFHEAAYAAFRMGYSTMAAATLAGTPDGERFSREATRHRERLSASLAV
jgi:hypothetical protein